MDKIIALTAAQRAEVFQAAAQQSGMSAVILEKDFWVCWTLRRLFALPGIGGHLIFKGGTSLSKVWKAISRFSEDIDVSLSREWLGFTGEHDPEQAGSRKQQKKRLDDLSAACAEKIRTVLLPALRLNGRAHLGDSGWQIELDAEDPQTVLFNYPSAVAPAVANGYVRREVRIECGARSDAWPAEHKVVQPYVAEALAGVVADAEVAVKVLGIERTYWENATILHAEAHREAGKATPPRFSRHYAGLGGAGGSCGGKGCGESERFAGAGGRAQTGVFRVDVGELRDGSAGEFPAGAGRQAIAGTGAGLPGHGGNVFRRGAPVGRNRGAAEGVGNEHQRAATALIRGRS